MLKEKTLLNVPGYEDKEIVIKRFNYGEKSRLSGITTSVVIDDNNKTNMTVNVEKSRVYTLVFGIKSAPFFVIPDEAHKVNAVNQLDDETGSFLLNEIRILNQPADDNIKKS